MRIAANRLGREVTAPVMGRAIQRKAQGPAVCSGRGSIARPGMAIGLRAAAVPIAMFVCQLGLAEDRPRRLVEGRDPGLRADHVGDLVDIVAVVLVAEHLGRVLGQPAVVLAADQKRHRIHVYQHGWS